MASEKQKDYLQTESPKDSFQEDSPRVQKLTFALAEGKDQTSLRAGLIIYCISVFRSILVNFQIFRILQITFSYRETSLILLWPKNVLYFSSLLHGLYSCEYSIYMRRLFILLFWGVSFSCLRNFCLRIRIIWFQRILGFTSRYVGSVLPFAPTQER